MAGFPLRSAAIMVSVQFQTQLQKQKWRPDNKEPPWLAISSPGLSRVFGGMRSCVGAILVIARTFFTRRAPGEHSGAKPPKVRPHEETTVSF
jgi:hypothetical protein